LASRSRKIGLRGTGNHPRLDLYGLIDYIINVKKSYSLTETKARFSEILNRLVHEKDIVVITKKRENVAVLVPFERFNELDRSAGAGLIRARGALCDLDREIENMARLIAISRAEEKSREVNL